MGRYLGQALSDQGYKVYTSVRSEEDKQSLLNDAANKVIPFIMDVIYPESILQAKKTVGDIHVLINNAGIVVSGPLELVGSEDFARQLDVNVTGVLRVTQAFLPGIRQNKGKIINIGSMSCRFPVPFLGPYSVSKIALKQLTKALQLELSPWEVGVHHIEAGNFKTPIWEKSLNSSQQLIDQLQKNGEPLYVPFLIHALSVMKAKSNKVNDPVLLTRKIKTIIEGSSRQFNYVVGNDAKNRGLISRWIPETLRDRLLRNKFRLIKR